MYIDAVFPCPLADEISQARGHSRQPGEHEYVAEPVDAYGRGRDVIPRFDRLFGELAKVEYFSRFAAANGDVVTPIIIASSEADMARTRKWNAVIWLYLGYGPRVFTSSTRSPIRENQRLSK